MSSAALALNRIEFQSDTIIQEASQTATKAVNAVSRNLKFGQVYFQLKSVSSDLQDFLDYLCSPAIPAAFEQASTEDQTDIVVRMGNVDHKIESMISSLRSARLGFWTRHYVPLLKVMEKRNVDLGLYVETLKGCDVAILLSSGDQKQFVETLVNPPSPNDSLRRAFSR